MYRPEGWKNPYGIVGTYWPEEAQFFEDGADAMLKVLQGQGIRVETIREVMIPMNMTFVANSKGWVAFIPDDEPVMTQTGEVPVE